MAKDPSSFQKAVEELGALTSEHPTFNDVEHTSPQVLRRFIIARKCNVGAAYKLWEGWAQWRHDTKPELITWDKVRDEVERTRKVTIEGFDKQGRPAIVVRIKAHKIGEYPAEDTFRSGVYTLETSASMSRERADGYLCLIFDCADVSMQNLDLGLTIKKPGLLFLYQECYPETLKTVLIVNSGFLFRTFFRLLLPFLDENMRSKIHFITRPEQMLEFFDYDGLPEDYRSLFADFANKPGGAKDPSG